MLTYQLLFSVTTSDVKPINSQNSHTIIICSNWKKKQQARDSSEKGFRSHPLAEIENKAISLSDKMQQRHG